MLTGAQQKLVEDNHMIIYKFLHDYKLPKDDFYDICAIGLCKAAEKWKPGKGTAFSTYAYTHMYRDFQQYLYLQSMQKRSKCTTCSLDVTITDGGSTKTLEMCLPFEDDYSDIFCSEILDSLPPKESFVCRMCADGYPYTEIGSYLGVSRQRVLQLKRQARNRLKGMRVMVMNA